MWTEIKLAFVVQIVISIIGVSSRLKFVDRDETRELMRKYVAGESVETHELIRKSDHENEQVGKKSAETVEIDLKGINAKTAFESKDTVEIRVKTRRRNYDELED